MDVKNKIGKEMSKMDSEEKDSILESFDKFRNYISEKIEFSKNMGLSDDKLAKATEFVANYLAKHEEPHNREEHLLMELWKVGSKEEQEVFSQMLLKMIKNQ